MSDRAQHIMLIGMSGLGKSYWSRRLAQEHGFLRFGCDDEIQRILSEELGERESIRDLGKWMGMPYENRFEKREAQYLAAETRVMEQALQLIEQANAQGKRCVIDSSGSVIYVPQELLERLRNAAVLVLLDFTMDHFERMFDQFRARPRPIVWRGMFRPQAGEETKAALARCYRDLLHSRHELYSALAEVSVPYESYRKKELRTEEFLGAIFGR